MKDASKPRTLFSRSAHIPSMLSTPVSAPSPGFPSTVFMYNKRYPDIYTSTADVTCPIQEKYKHFPRRKKRQIIPSSSNLRPLRSDSEANPKPNFQSPTGGRNKMPGGNVRQSTPRERSPSFEAQGKGISLKK